MSENIITTLWWSFHLTNVFLCYEDIKNKEVSLGMYALLTIQMITLNFIYKNEIIITGIVLFLLSIFITSFFLKKEVIGFADISYVLLCLLFLEQKWPLFFINIGIAGILIHKVTNTKKGETIPFFPVIYASFVLSSYFF